MQIRAGRASENAPLGVQLAQLGLDAPVAGEPLPLGGAREVRHEVLGHDERVLEACSVRPVSSSHQVDEERGEEGDGLKAATLMLGLGWPYVACRSDLSTPTLGSHVTWRSLRLSVGEDEGSSSTRGILAGRVSSDEGGAAARLPVQGDRLGQRSTLSPRERQEGAPDGDDMARWGGEEERRAARADRSRQGARRTRPERHLLSCSRVPR